MGRFAVCKLANKDSVMNQMNFIFCRVSWLRWPRKVQLLTRTASQSEPQQLLFALLKEPRGGFEVTPTIQNSLSCTQQMQALLWFHPRFLRFGFGIRQVKACLTPTCSNPQGPPWEGTTLQLCLLLFYMHKVSQTPEAIKLIISELCCNGVGRYVGSDGFWYINFFFLHISQPTSQYFLLSSDTPVWSWSTSHPIFSFSVRLTFVNLEKKIVRVLELH